MFRVIEIAGMVCPNNVFLAPLAGYTNYPFRDLCRSLGAGLTFTEMVSCKGLAYNSEETKKLLYCGDESPKAAQIFGSDPQIMRAACESEELAPYDLIDINMGCPMPKIVRNGEGSALMENLPLAEKVIAACVKSGKRISVKFRIGVTEDRKIAAEFAKLCAGAGACMITVHGRTREKIYAGPPDYKEIAAAKNAVGIPVFANGGIWSKGDAEKTIDRTGADGVMIARAALYRPQIFSEFTGKTSP
ncbi:MAG: tRNA-dihydrouridine synthase family protein, partial [Clostridia bacterium]|nr:tRNA-dihydrouridine synthase family protein [Clostridia bacterium]